MKLWFALLFVAIIVATAVLGAPVDDDLGINMTWEEYKQKFNKHYATPEEDEMRRQRFIECKERVMKKKKDAKLPERVSRYCDLDLDESVNDFVRLDIESPLKSTTIRPTTLSFWRRAFRPRRPNQLY